MRREAFVTIAADGRDKGKVFGIREMDAASACEWFDRAAQLIARGGADVPSDLFEHGPAGFVVIGLGSILSSLGKAPYTEVKPLLDELMGCVTSLRSPGTVADVTNAAMIKGQIEEVGTFLQLREEVLSLHLGFSLRGRLSTFRPMIAAMMAGSGQNTETSDARSGSSPQADSPTS